MREMNKFGDFSAWRVTNENFRKYFRKEIINFTSISSACLSRAIPRTTAGKYTHAVTVVFCHRQLFNTVPPTRPKSSFRKCFEIYTCTYTHVLIQSAVSLLRILTCDKYMCNIFCTKDNEY